ncbi:MAG: LEM-3-like GIY-YIG domain-containing protein [Acidimicrobiales bacterium]
MDAATVAPSQAPADQPAGEAPTIGVASLPVLADEARPPVPVPSMPLTPDTTAGTREEPAPADATPEQGHTAAVVARPVAPTPDPPGRGGPDTALPASPIQLSPLPTAPDPAPVTEDAPDTPRVPVAEDAADGPVGASGTDGGFAPGVAARLRSYVYLLVDPRTGRPFYVGHGKGERCFRHVSAARRAGTTDDLEQKYPGLGRIREIESGGRSVRVDILRHGLSPDEALLVAAATHEALGLSGEPVLGCQRRPAAEVSALLAKRAKFKPCHQVVLLRIGGAGADFSYERIRHGWRIGRRWTDPESPRSPRWAVTVVGDMVASVYRIERWEPTVLGPDPAGTAGRAGAQAPDRHSFVGTRDPELERRYVGRSAAAYVGAGAQGTMTYVWCGPHWVNTAH